MISKIADPQTTKRKTAISHGAAGYLLSDGLRLFETLPLA